jgi:hypothetical protein
MSGDGDERAAMSGGGNGGVAMSWNGDGRAAMIGKLLGTPGNAPDERQWQRMRCDERRRLGTAAKARDAEKSRGLAARDAGKLEEGLAGGAARDAGKL